MLATMMMKMMQDDDDALVCSYLYTTNVCVSMIRNQRGERGPRYVINNFEQGGGGYSSAGMDDRRRETF